MARAKGIDISKWQLSFQNKNNIDFIIQRASYGLTRDEKFDQLVLNVQDIERRGTYHYFMSGFDWLQQAELFLDIVTGYRFKFLVLDYEQTNNNLTAGSAADAYDMIQYLKEETGKPVLLYTSAYIYRDNLHAYNDAWNDEDIWIARYYFDDAYAQVNDPNMLGIREDWKLWQYTDQGNGAEYGVGSTRVDLNVFNGTVEEMDDWLNIPPVVEPPTDCCEELEDILDAHWALMDMNRKKIDEIDNAVFDQVNRLNARIDKLEQKAHLHPQWMDRFFRRD